MSKPMVEAIPQSNVGSASFDAADRLAIVNVLNSYGYFVDQLRMDDYFGLFTDAPEVEAWFAGERAVHDWKQFKDLSTARQEVFKREKIQRRHVLSAPRFDQQDNESASGQVYFRLYRIHHGTISLITIGYYEFTMAKQRGEWKIDRWIIRADNGID